MAEKAGTKGGNVNEDARSTEPVLSFTGVEAGSGRVGPNEAVSELLALSCGPVYRCGIRLLGRELCRESLRCLSIIASHGPRKAGG